MKYLINIIIYHHRIAHCTNTLDVCSVCVFAYAIVSMCLCSMSTCLCACVFAYLYLSVLVSVHKRCGGAYVCTSDEIIHTYVFGAHTSAHTASTNNWCKWHPNDCSSAYCTRTDTLGPPSFMSTSGAQLSTYDDLNRRTVKRTDS